MPPRRQQVFNNRQDTVFPFAPSIPPPTPTAAQMQRVDRRVQDDIKAKAREVEFAGSDTSFVQYGQLDPVVLGADSTASLWAFTVPAGRVLIIDRIQIGLSEPLLYSNGQFGWRLTLSDGVIVFHSSQGTIAPRPDVIPLPLGGVEPDSMISPVYAQAEMIVELQLVEVNPSAPGSIFQEYLAAWGFGFGTMRKTAGGL